MQPCNPIGYVHSLEMCIRDRLQEDCLLFLDVDPNLTVCSTVPFAAGMKFAVTYHYYPLGLSLIHI